MMGLGKSKPRTNFGTKFQVARFIAEIIKGNPQLCRASLAQGHAHFFPLSVLWWALANPSCTPNFKSLASASVKIIKENTPKFCDLP